MKIIEVPIEKLKFSQNHLRISLNKNDKMFNCLIASISTFGLQYPLLINEGYEIISGNQILRVLKFLNWEKVPCIISDISKDKEIDLNIAINKIDNDWFILNVRKYFKENNYSKKELQTLGFDKLEIDSLTALDKFPNLDKDNKQDSQLKIF